MKATPEAAVKSDPARAVRLNVSQVTNTPPGGAGWSISVNVVLDEAVDALHDARLELNQKGLRIEDQETRGMQGDVRHVLVRDGQDGGVPATRELFHRRIAEGQENGLVPLESVSLWTRM